MGVVGVTHSLEDGQGTVVSWVNTHCRGNSHTLLSLEEAVQLLSEGEEGLATSGGCVGGE